MEWKTDGPSGSRKRFVFIRVYSWPKFLSKMSYREVSGIRHLTKKEGVSQTEESMGRQTKRLIVNADDFGLTAGVNRAIIEGHTRGAITSATLMANMPAFDAAVRLAKDHPSLGVGLHINITQGRPVADASRVSSLINDRGEFL